MSPLAAQGSFECALECLIPVPVNPKRHHGGATNRQGNRSNLQRRAFWSLGILVLQQIAPAHPIPSSIYYVLLNPSASVWPTEPGERATSFPNSAQGRSSQMTTIILHKRCFVRVPYLVPCGNLPPELLKGAYRTPERGPRSAAVSESSKIWDRSKKRGTGVRARERA